MVLSITLLCTLSLVGQAFRFKRSRQQARVVTFQGVDVHNYKEKNKEWVVLFKADTSDSSIRTFCHGQCDFQGHPDQKGFAFAKFHGSEEELEQSLTGRTDVDFIEVDEIDSLIPEIESLETQALASWGLERIGADARASTGKGVHIYVADTGIRTSHTDFGGLGGRAVGAFDMTSGSAVECTSRDASCAIDRQGHGTHCAGTASGSDFGVAPDAKVYAVKVLSDQGRAPRSWIYEGIDWVTTNRKTPAVLSMSLGGRGRVEGYHVSLGVAMRAGVTVVVAAGNSKSDTCNFSPAFSSNAITVGATDRKNMRAGYSNYGTCNDIMAPGSSIVSAGVRTDTATKTSSGTSMACPHVAGAAALLLEKRRSLTKDQILNKLKETAVQNLIGGLKPGDPNYFLWVSSEPADSPPPTPAPPSRCPSFAVSETIGPYGDCKCPYPQKCSRNGGASFACPCEQYGLCAGGIFSPACTECKCYA